MQFWGVQVEAGSVATAFQTATGTIQGELAACQRYFYTVANTISQPLFNGCYFNSTGMYGILYYPVEMRVVPTLAATTATNNYEFLRSGAGDYFNSLSAYGTSKICATLFNNTEMSGTAGDAGWVSTNNIFSGLVSFSAEL
jgi:hypothetical protein